MSDRAAPRRDHVEALWTRVDHNRRKLALFIVGWVLGLSLPVAAGIGLIVFLLHLPSSGLIPAAELSALIWRSLLLSWVAAAALAGAYVGIALFGPEKRLLRKLGAVLTPTGQYLTSKDALKDMAIAAGFRYAPPLWVIPDCTRVNAFAVGRNPARAIVGITQGLADKLDHDEQRAVFANVMAKVARGNILWATGVSALAGPLWALRERDLRAGSDETMAEVLGGTPREFAGNDAQGAVGLWFVYLPIIILSEMLLAGHQRSARLSAEQADAEGMLLLKDPRDMLRALTDVLGRNHTVPTAGEAYSLLFYAWAGFGYAPEDDPEISRVARLREILGAEGMAGEAAVASPAVGQ